MVFARQGDTAMARFNFGTLRNDTILGPLTEANTFFAFGAGADNLFGGNLDDMFEMLVDEKADSINGGKGQDTVDYGLSDRGVSIDLAAGKVTASFTTGGAHTSVVANLTSIENATGSNFADRIVGTSTFNTLDGGLGNDILDGAGGINTVSFVSHDQTPIANGDQFNIMLGSHGGDGSMNWLAMVSPNQFVEKEWDTLRNFQNVIGSNNSEAIIGNEQDNNINGRGGDDVISGGEGNDVLNGGDGNDRLIGSAGIDTMTGGAGADRFVFLSTSDSPISDTADLITDFEHGIDKIDLSRIDADSETPGFQHFGFTDAALPDTGLLNIFYDVQHNVTHLNVSISNDLPGFHVTINGFVTQSDFIL